MQCPFCLDGDMGWLPASLVMHVNADHPDRMYGAKPEPSHIQRWPRFPGDFPGVDIDAVHRVREVA